MPKPFIFNLSPFADTIRENPKSIICEYYMWVIAWVFIFNHSIIPKENAA